MSLILTATQQATYTVAFVDGKGNPAPVQGPPVWASSMPTVVSVTPSPDGMSCLAKAVGTLGDAQLSVTADAEMDDGVTEIVGLDTITVVAGQAVSASMTAGTPEEQAPTRR